MVRCLLTNFSPKKGWRNAEEGSVRVLNKIANGVQIRKRFCRTKGEVMPKVHFELSTISVYTKYTEIENCYYLE